MTSETQTRNVYTISEGRFANNSCRSSLAACGFQSVAWRRAPALVGSWEMGLPGAHARFEWSQALRRTRAKAPAGAGRRLAREAVRGAPRVRLGGGPRGHPLGGRELGRPVPLAARGGVACHPGTLTSRPPCASTCVSHRGRVASRPLCPRTATTAPPHGGYLRGTLGRARLPRRDVRVREGERQGGESGPAPATPFAIGSRHGLSGSPAARRTPKNTWWRGTARWWTRRANRSGRRPRRGRAASRGGVLVDVQGYPVDAEGLPVYRLSNTTVCSRAEGVERAKLDVAFIAAAPTPT